MVEKPSYMGCKLRNKAAGEVLTAKQAPHRPGTAPALGLRAGSDGLLNCVADPLLKGIQSPEEIDPCFS
jgi:hypothetical protein